MTTTKPQISIIVALAENRAIGRDNNLLWHISEDLRNFKKITNGHTVIMGRKTWESLGRPLPNRRNIVVSRNMSNNLANSIPGVEFYPSINEAIEAASASTEKHPDSLDEIFIIGGGEIYRETIPIASKIYLTLVHAIIDDADTFFPKLNPSEWHEIHRESFDYGEKYEHPFEFVVLERNSVK